MNRTITLLVSLLAALLIAGCQPAAKPAAPTAHVTNIDDVMDPCAEQLHALCEKILLYFYTNKELPETLAELYPHDANQKAVPGRLTPERAGNLPQSQVDRSNQIDRSNINKMLICPASGQPYIYDRDGLSVVGRAGRLIVYDALTSHMGMIQGILIEPPRAGQPLVARVVRLPQQAIIPEANP